MPLRGIAYLPLHYGHMPRWLYEDMVKLAGAITKIIVFEYGKREMLKRLSDPFWFQAFGCVLGFDWHSSGLTTTVTAALRDAFKKNNIGLYIAGGKGKTSRKTLEHIEIISEKINFTEKQKLFLKETSRIIAKIDNSVLQDSFDLYHHTIIFDENAKYVVIQQGMNEFSSYARRYHWIYEDVKEKGYFSNSHSGIITSFKLPKVIDLSSKKSEEARKQCVDLAKEKIGNLKKEIINLTTPKMQKKLIDWMDVEISNEFIKEKNKEKIKKLILKSEHEIFKFNKHINWNALKEAYEKNPSDFKELINIKGMGKNTIRALCLISAIIYGKEPSWTDPASYSFAHGGKDGVPYSINKIRYEKSIDLLYDAIKNAEIGNREKLDALKRLNNFLS